MATAVLAGDLTASLSFFLAQEVTTAFEDYFGINEVILISLATTALAAWVAKLSESTTPGERNSVLLTSFHELAKTVTFLSGTITVQIAVLLVRQSIGLAVARVLTVLSTLLLIRTLLFATDLSKHELVYTPVARSE